MSAAKAGLGRGLASLLGEDYSAPPPDAGALKRLPLGALRPSPTNPRKTFDTEQLEELAQSIATRGLVQPIVVRAVGDDLYEIVAGERRFRAATLAKLAEVPVVIVEADDGAALEIAIVENVQRADLNVVEEARGYGELMERFGYAQSDLARTLSKSRSHVTNTMRLLRLPDTVLDHLSAGRLTAGQARPLIGRDDAQELADRIVNEGLSARAIERLVKGRDDETPNAPGTPGPKDTARLDDVRRRFEARLGIPVQVSAKGRRGGVTLTLADEDALDRLLRFLDPA